MHVEVSGAERLLFGDGSPVRAASAVVPFGDGYLVISDDAVHAAWFRRGGEPTRLRLLPSVDGEEVFDEELGTKHHKPDLEAALTVTVVHPSGATGSGRSPTTRPDSGSSEENLSA